MLKLSTEIIQMGYDQDNMDALSEPDPQHYKLLTILGRSCDDRAIITLAKHIPSNRLVTVRQIHLELYEKDFEVVLKELQVCRQLNHPNLLPYMCSFVYNSELWMVMPLMAYGSARDLLQAAFNDGLPETAIAYVLRDVIKAVEYLHAYGYIHRSIRAGHVLLSTDGSVCLTGLHSTVSMLADGKKFSAVYDYPNDPQKMLMWLAPEVLEQNMTGYSSKSDIYSIGILACELANGAIPFADLPATQMLLEKVYGSMPILLDTTTISGTVEDGIEKNERESNGVRDGPSAYYQRTFSPHFHNFVTMCLQKDPLIRPSASELLNHAFFKQLRRRSVESLPQLLQPVQPISEHSKFPDCQMKGLTDQLDALEMDDEWSF